MIGYSGSYFLINQDFKDIGYLNPSVFEQGTVLYEVVRVNGKVVLFLEDHLHRFQQSVSLSGHTEDLSAYPIRELLRMLVLKNGISEGNIKILFHFAPEQLPDLYAFFIPHVYPSDEMYALGVDADLFRAERAHPNIKKMHAALVRDISLFVNHEKIYDALLVDEHQQITEGSKTNVFFIRGQQLITAPGEMVLKGITREKVLSLCRQLNINIMESPVPVSALKELDGAFFTGTSPKILPIRRIGGSHYPVSQQIMRTIMNAYDDMIDDYMAGTR